MKTTITRVLSSLLFILSGILLTAQSCLPGGISFYTQAEINDFAANYPGCTEIIGYVEIQGADITDLSGLSQVTSTGQLFIYDNANLGSLSGLENLTSVGSFDLSNNPGLNNLNGLDNITSIGGSLNIRDHTNLQNLSGLDNLNSVGGQLEIKNNNVLTDISALSNLSSVASRIDISNNNLLPSLTGLENISTIHNFLTLNNNPALLNLNGLENLVSISGSLQINNNASLQNLNALQSLTMVGGALSITNCMALMSLNGLNNVSSVGENVRINLNPELNSLAGLDNLTTIGAAGSFGLLEIHSNVSLTSLNGLQNLTSVLSSVQIHNNDMLSSLSGLEGLSSIGSFLEIRDNPALASLTGLDNLSSISGDIQIFSNDALTSLTGIENVDPTTISALKVYNNPQLSECDVQSICDFLAIPSMPVEIHDNAAGCDSENEVESACFLCLSNSLFISSQSQIDNFAYDYPGCTKVISNLIIEGGVNIYNLDGLAQLTEIGGTLRIANNTFLFSLTGLDNLYSVGNLIIDNNDALGSLDGLNRLETIGSSTGHLKIENNNMLNVLNGLNSLETIGGDMIIHDNGNIANLEGLDNLNSVGGNVELYNDAFTDLDGLANLAYVGKDFKIYSNNALVSIDGFNNLAEIGEFLWINDNDQLTSINGLNGLSTIGNDMLLFNSAALLIYNNAALKYLNGFQNLSYIKSYLRISNNAVLENINGFSNLATIGSALAIFDNASLTHFSGLSNVSSIGGSGTSIRIENNSSLVNLDGLSGLTSTTSLSEILIKNNNALTNLNGLNNMTFIAKLNLEGNNSLINLEGLNSLVSLSQLRLYSNPALQSLSGLDNVSTLYGLNILSNISLTDISSLSNLTYLGNLLLQNNIVLTSLNGLENITSIGSHIEITGNTSLTSLSPLSNVTSIDGLIYINNNAALTSLDGLQNIDPAGIQSPFIPLVKDLTIRANQQLSQCEVESICQFLTFPGITTDITGNAPGCNSQAEIEQACDPLGAICQALVVDADASCQANASAEEFDGGSTSNSPLSFDVFPEGAYPLGMTYVTLTVTDQNNNSATCNTYIKVEDNTPPTAICLSNTVEIQASGTYTLTTTDVLDISSSVDNCPNNTTPSGIAEVIFPSTTYTCDDIGQSFTISVEVNDLNGNTANCSANIQVEAGDALPPEWSSSDIGMAPLGNDFTYDPCTTPTTTEGEYTISGSGNNAASTSTDNLAFASQTLCGDGTITTKIESVSPNGYGGLMIRETNDAGSKQTSIFSNMTNILRHEARYANNAPKQISSFYKPSPFWLQLERTGSWIFAYYSTTGNNFQYVHAVYIPMQPCVEVGLASFTYTPNAQTQAVFSNVSTTGNNGGLSDDGELFHSDTKLRIENVGKGTISQHSNITDLNFDLYPNPASSNVTLKLTHILQEQVPIAIFNQYGQLIENEFVAANAISVNWDTQEWPVGTYWIVLKQPNTNPVVKKLNITR